MWEIGKVTNSVSLEVMAEAIVSTCQLQSSLGILGKRLSQNHNFCLEGMSKQEYWA